MNKDYEFRIVKSFIQKERQDRLLYELGAATKRNDAIYRFCHRYALLFIPKYMIEIPKPNSIHTEIYKLLKAYGANENCYVISSDSQIDGQSMPLIDALQRAVGFGMPSIISCIPDKLIYFEAEQEDGPPPRFILKKD